MAHKSQLRDIHCEMVLNETSSKQEKVLVKAVHRVELSLYREFPGIVLKHEKQWLLADVVKRLRDDFPSEEFTYFFESSAMRPDGGILYIVADDGKLFPILISEKKNQGTNDIRALEGKKKQAKGNAIERLGKNVIGFRTAMLSESIFPFVCFGDGCDFSEDSSILDRVVTIAEFGELNKEYLHNSGKNGIIDRGSFYFRLEEWTESEMFERCYSIAKRSVYYYFSKYGEDAFIN